MNTDPPGVPIASGEAASGSAPLYSTGDRAPETFSSPVDGPSPPLTASYPSPLTGDAPYTGSLSVQVVSGLAYFTVVPAIVFLLLEPYRSHAVIRFHSWQSIFYFVVLAAVRVVEMLLVSMLPVGIAFTISGLMSLALFLGWLMATIKAFQGSKLHLFIIGKYAEQAANTASTR